MKRLNKKFKETYAEVLKNNEVPMEIRFLFDWVASKKFMALNNADAILKNNPDCAYKGQGYRLYTIDKDTFNSKCKQSINDYSYDEYYQLEKDQVDNIAEEIINNKDQRYRSFAKNLDGIYNFWYSLDKSDTRGNIYWMVSSDIEGIDIELLYEKYQNLYPDYEDSKHSWGMWTGIADYLGEQEVVAKPGSPYELLGYYTESGRLAKNYFVDIQDDSVYLNEV